MMPLRTQFSTEQEWLEHLKLWFAGMALQGYLSAPGRHGEIARENSDRAAEWCYATADAMIKRGKV